MTDPQIHSLIAQVQTNTARIEIESQARVVADEVLAKRIGSIEKALVGDVQSANYVPGISGWKLEKDGTFEINSCILGSAAKAPERQTVSVEVASWSKYDLPKNAANLLQFMQAELQKVPEEYRHAAEFEEFDASYGDESFNARLFLSYSRLETEEELAHRLEKAKVAGTHVSIKNGEMTVTHDGVLRFKIGGLRQLEPKPEQVHPFIIGGKQFAINSAFTQDGAIASAKVDATSIDQVNKRLDELKEKQGAENRAVADRLDSLATKLGELHTLISQAKDSATAQAKREVADALLRDIEADKSGGTISDFIRRFGVAPLPFSGYTGDIPRKR